MKRIVRLAEGLDVTPSGVSCPAVAHIFHFHHATTWLHASVPRVSVILSRLLRLTTQTRRSIFPEKLVNLWTNKFSKLYFARFRRMRVIVKVIINQVIRPHVIDDFDIVSVGILFHG